jgi:hypothetical protein
MDADARLPIAPPGGKYAYGAGVRHPASPDLTNAKDSPYSCIGLLIAESMCMWWLVGLCLLIFAAYKVMRAGRFIDGFFAQLNKQDSAVNENVSSAREKTGSGDSR